MSAQPLLQVLHKGETVSSQPLDQDVLIGRGESCVIRLQDRLISRKHVLVKQTAEGVVIEKQSEFAPLTVNGQDCARAVIKEGDVIALGPYLLKLSGKVSEAKQKEEAVQAIQSAAQEVIAKPVIAEAAPVLEVPLATPLTAAAPILETQDTDKTKPLDLNDVNANADFVLNDSIFDSPADALDVGGPAEAVPMDVDLDAKEGSNSNQSLEIDVGSDGAVGEDAKTKVLKKTADAKIVLKKGDSEPSEFSIEKTETTFGRGKNCDIVLGDKKSSRKNCVIIRDGNRFILKDLESANGTYLNGKKIKEAQLSGEDIIRIGGTEFEFVALNSQYAKGEKDFLAVEEEADQQQYVPESMPMGGQNAPLATPLQASPPPGFQPQAEQMVDPNIVLPMPQEEQSGRKSLYEKYIKNFNQLKPVQKLLVVMVVGYFLMWYMEEEPKKVVKKSPTVVKKDGGVLTFDQLTPEQKKYIESQYQLAFDFYTKKDYDKTLYEVRKIFPILPEYDRAKELERFALSGKQRLEAIEEERKKAEEEARVRARIEELVEQASLLMSKKQYDKAKEVFAEILSVDPENAKVAAWKKEIDSIAEEKQRNEQEVQVQAEINKRAWDQYNEAFELHKEGKYHAAIDAYQRVPEIGSDDKKLLNKVKTMIEACQESIKDIRDPIIAKAKEHEAQGDLASAYREFERSTRIDPPFFEGYAGMERIRDVLNDRAKGMYTEAVIAESYSDFKTAFNRYREILNTAPQDSLYYQRAQRKLASYSNFKFEEPEQK